MLRRAGFTLLEILLVVVIVALLAAILLPVVSMAKRYSSRGVCIEQLRQIGVAVAMYEADNQTLPRNLDELREAQVAGIKSIALCPSDPVKGFSSRFDACRKKPHNFPQTYETMLDWIPEMADRLKAADPNHGVAVCRVHGDRAPSYALGMRQFCDYAWHMFEGPLLRLRRDGSVQTAKYRLHRRTANGVVLEESALVWELFTDVPDPKGPRR